MCTKVTIRVTLAATVLSFRSVQQEQRVIVDPQNAETEDTNHSDLNPSRHVELPHERPRNHQNEDVDDEVGDCRGIGQW